MCLTWEIIDGKHIEGETASDHKQLIDRLLEQGFTIQAVVLDGKRCVAKAFGDIPVRMCHFHRFAIVKRYLTKNPKLEASIHLLKICRKLATATEARFDEVLTLWYLNTTRS